MEFGDYPRVSNYAKVRAAGIDDILNVLAQKRRAQEQEMEFQPLQTIQGLNAVGGVPVRQEGPLGTMSINMGQPFGSPYDQVDRLQRQTFKQIKQATPKSYTIRGAKLKSGRPLRISKGGGGSRSKKNYGKGVKGSVRNVARQYGWDSGAEWRALVKLVHKESSWRPDAANPTSSARGLFQKMTSIHGPVEGSVQGQAKWGLNYIKKRYGSPSRALAFHLRNNWY